jgi:protein SCO1/2
MKYSAFLVAAVLIFGSILHWYAPEKETFETISPSTDLPVLGSAPSFELIDHTSKKFSSSSLSGKLWVLNFFFSSCKHICPTVNGSVKSLVKRFEAEKISFVSISVDPKRDTPERLAAYRSRFTDGLDHWRMLSAPSTDIERIQHELHLSGGALPDNHTTRIVLVDEDGLVRGYYRALEEEEISRLAEDIQTLLGR